MLYARRSRVLSTVVACLCVCCVALLTLEARSARTPGDWARLGGGLGTSAGTDAGFFAFDARLESVSDSALGPLPGVALCDGAAAAGVWVFEPIGVESAH